MLEANEMRYYTHIVAAILFFLLFDYIFNIENEDLLFGIILTSFISVFPDLIDIISKSKHRGFGHSLLLWIPIIFLIGIISFNIGNLIILAAVLTALVSHILLDIITKHGYPFLYPKKTIFVALNEKRRIKTGTKQDKAVFIFLILLLIPALLFSFDIINFKPPQYLSSNQAGTIDQNHSVKENINVNIDSHMKNTNITIKNVKEDEIQITVKNINMT